MMAFLIRIDYFDTNKRTRTVGFGHIAEGQKVPAALKHIILAI